MSDWYTFSQLAEKFEITPEAARQRSIRGNWKRQINNDGNVIVFLPDEFYVRPRKKNKKPNVSSENTAPKQSQSFQNKEKDLERIIAVLESHIGTLEKEISFAREALVEERKIALESLQIVKKLTAELAEIKSSQRPLPSPQAESMATILQRMKVAAAAKKIAAA